MKIKFVSSSFIMFSVRLITTAITFKSVGENSIGGRYPTFTLSKYGSETSSLNPLQEGTLGFSFIPRECTSTKELNVDFVDCSFSFTGVYFRGLADPRFRKSGNS